MKEFSEVIRKFRGVIGEFKRSNIFMKHSGALTILDMKPNRYNMEFFTTFIFIQNKISKMSICFDEQGGSIQYKGN